MLAERRSTSISAVREGTTGSEVAGKGAETSTAADAVAAAVAAAAVAAAVVAVAVAASSKTARAIPSAEEEAIATGVVMAGVMSISEEDIVVEERRLLMEWVFIFFEKKRRGVLVPSNITMD